ncbi:MAG: GIY-YIG nuclease family protein [Clostridia bacterium]|nr:GIY-YIG nuclease family protein [Clostridia bacterium]MBQ8873639.1 GIY-YIG nuclease family protein [Clostridia bacterium]
MYYIYILTNSTHKVLYIGVTNNLQRRVWEHKNKIHDGFSKKYKTDILVYFESAGQVEDAIAREKQLKKWNRQKKESLINSLNPQWNDLFEGMLQ